MRETVLGKSFIDPAVAGKLLSRVGDGQAQPATLITEKLTEREMDVLRLLARGLNNAEIAAYLFLYGVRSKAWQSVCELFKYYGVIVNDFNMIHIGVKSRRMSLAPATRH